MRGRCRRRAGIGRYRDCRPKAVPHTSCRPPPAAQGSATAKAAAAKRTYRQALIARPSTRLRDRRPRGDDSRSVASPHHTTDGIPHTRLAESEVPRSLVVAVYNVRPVLGQRSGHGPRNHGARWPSSRAVRTVSVAPPRSGCRRRARTLPSRPAPSPIWIAWRRKSAMPPGKRSSASPLTCAMRRPCERWWKPSPTAGAGSTSWSTTPAHRPPRGSPT